VPDSRGLDPGIQGAGAANEEPAERSNSAGRVDGRVKPGHDENFKCDSLPRFAGEGLDGVWSRAGGKRMTQHIGIVACSAEGASLCYRTICVEGAALMGGVPHAHPEISLHGFSLADYVACLERGDWPGVGELMLGSAEKLARLGADFLICPDNTIHAALPLIRARSPLPWLHIAEVVAAEAAARGFRRLALTGTRWLVESEVYPEALAARGIETVRPTAAERDAISRIIMDELVRSDFRPASTEYLRRVIARMGEAGCDAVVLGCTELPLVIEARHSPLPVLDSTRLLARAALAQACGGERR
jgi:aspartate racemase